MTEEQAKPGEPSMPEGIEPTPLRPPRASGGDPGGSELDPREGEAGPDDEDGSDVVVDKTDMSAVGDDGQVFGG